MKKQLFLFVLFGVFAFFASSHIEKKNTLPASSFERRPATALAGVAGFPEISKDSTIDKAAALAIAKLKLNSGVSASDLQSRLSHYAKFLGLKHVDITAAMPKPNPSKSPTVPRVAKSVEADGEDDDGSENPKAFPRLLQSSAQFLFCDDLTDWACLEKSTPYIPTLKDRVETQADLGTPVNAGAQLDVTPFFTQAWDKSAPGPGDITVAQHLADQLKSDAGKSIRMALYGIDDITATLKPVWDEILPLVKQGNVQAVFDITSFQNTEVDPKTKKKTARVLNFSYVQPSVSLENWILGKLDGVHLNTVFQYDSTPDVMGFINDGIKTQDQANARLEWPVDHIMHNKFLVIENNAGAHSVWTGTANLSNHCMGSERNANMSIYIKNDIVATQAYLPEFEQLFQFNPKIKIANQNASSGGAVTGGLFHHNKTASTHRYFTFDDGTELRVHFAPTDDAEHRVILPMLYSARPGDRIRVSMFAGTGYELVRAFEYAAAVGAAVQIVFDPQQAAGLYSWVRATDAHIGEPNPYDGLIDHRGKPAGSLEVHVSTWPGKNHYKVGTITRAGASHAESIIVGSQNWSSGGNDENDENLVSIQNKKDGVAIADQFNTQFDTRLWKNSRIWTGRGKPDPADPGTDGAE